MIFKKKILEYCSYDEWPGDVYKCCFCNSEYIKDWFVFCPICGKSLKNYRFEKIEEEEFIDIEEVENDIDKKIQNKKCRDQEFTDWINNLANIIKEKYKK